MTEHLPENRKYEHYLKLEERLDVHAEIIENQLQRFISRALFAFAVIGITSAISLFGFTYVLLQQAKTSEKIQQQRFDTLFDSCEDTNERHEDVISQIDKAVKDIPPGPRHNRAVQSAKPFKLIITAAVPKRQDCISYADNRVKGDLRR